MTPVQGRTQNGLETTLKHKAYKRLCLLGVVVPTHCSCQEDINNNSGLSIRPVTLKQHVTNNRQSNQIIHLQIRCRVHRVKRNVCASNQSAVSQTASQGSPASSSSTTPMLLCSKASPLSDLMTSSAYGSNTSLFGDRSNTRRHMFESLEPMQHKGHVIIHHIQQQHNLANCIQRAFVLGSLGVLKVCLTMSLQTLSKDIQLSAILQITVGLGQKRSQ